MQTTQFCTRAAALAMALAVCACGGAQRPVASEGWQRAVLVEADSRGNASGAQTAFDATGNALAVWEQSDGARISIWANRYVAGRGWDAPELIETDDAGNAFHPKIAMNATGNAVVTWEQSDGARTSIWANRYTVGAGWQAAERIASNREGDAADPQIAMDISGNAFAAWEQFDGARFNVWVNRYEPGRGWGQAASMRTDATGSAYDPHISVDAVGNAFVVWEQFDGRRSSIWSSRYANSTGWGTATSAHSSHGDKLSKL